MARDLASADPVVSLAVRAARARRRSRARHDRLRGRLRGRRRAARLLVLTIAATAVAFADVPGLQGAADPVKAPAPAPRCPVPPGLRPAFVAASRATGLELGLLAAVARVESRFDADARSRVGAVGVLQLMPATAAELHYDALETRANVMAGALYLQQQLRRFGSAGLALAAYNAGPTAVERLGPRPTTETAAYVARVLRARRAYGPCR